RRGFQAWAEEYNAKLKSDMGKDYKKKYSLKSVYLDTAMSLYTAYGQFLQENRKNNLDSGKTPFVTYMTGLAKMRNFTRSTAHRHVEELIKFGIILDKKTRLR